MSEFVLDCCATIAYVFPDEQSDYVDHIFSLLLNNGKAYVSSNWPLEIAQACLGAQRRKRITENVSEEIFSILSAFPIQIEPSPSLQTINRIYSLAEFHSLSTYDAAYLDVSIQYSIPLVTIDKRLKQAANEAGVSLLTV